MGIITTIKTFFLDVRSEFRRVTWPTRDATLKSTGIVVFVTLVLAVYLGLIDLGLTKAIKLIIK